MQKISRRQALAVAVAGGVSAVAHTAVAAPAVVPSIWDGEKMYNTILKDGTGFSIPGPAGRKKAYVFFDSQCPDCIRLLDRAAPLKDKVELILYPIALLNIHSDPQGALMLSAKDPYKVLEEHHEHFRDADFRGVKYDITKLDPNVRNKVWANTKLHRRSGCRAVPYGVYKNSRGEFIPFDENLLTEELAKIFELK